MVLLLRNARETRGASRMAQLLVLAAGGSIAFNDDLDTGIMAGDLIVKTLTSLLVLGSACCASAVCHGLLQFVLVPDVCFGVERLARG